MCTKVVGSDHALWRWMSACALFGGVLCRCFLSTIARFLGQWLDFLVSVAWFVGSLAYISCFHGFHFRVCGFSCLVIWFVGLPPWLAVFFQWLQFPPSMVWVSVMWFMPLVCMVSVCWSSLASMDGLGLLFLWFLWFVWLVCFFPLLMVSSGFGFVWLNLWLWWLASLA